MRIKTPTIIQMERLECGAAALAIVLAYHGCHVPLDELRIACGISRDGSKASNILKAAREYGFDANGFTKEPEDLKKINFPFIVFWEFNHFVVVEGFKKDKVFINDPASGPRTISSKEFDQSFTGVVLTFKKSLDFEPKKKASNIFFAIKKRLSSSFFAIIFILIIGLYLIIPGIAVPAFLRIFIDNILIEKMNHWLLPLLGAMAFAIVIQGALVWIRQKYLLLLETKLALNFSSKFFQHILSLPITFFSNRYAGEIASRLPLNDDIAKLFSGQFSLAILNCFTVLFFLIVMFQYDVLLTSVVIILAILNIIFLFYTSRKRQDQNQRLLVDTGKLINSSVSGLKIIETLKSSGREQDFFSKWTSYNAKVFNTEQELGLSTRILSAVPVLFTSLSSILILGIGGFRVIKGDLTIGMLIAFWSLMSNFILPINNLVNMITSFEEFQGKITKVDEVFQYQEDVKTKNILEKPGPLEIKNISFGYSKLDEPFIKDFSLTLEQGKCIAIVGPSASGKTTLARLISGLYKPWSGDILLNGNSVSMVDEDFALFEDSVINNITLWDKTISQDHVLLSAKRACIHDVISARAGGYEYIIKEGGKNFSGGECQRIEITRALAGNPSVIILDEATNSLDEDLEKHVIDNIISAGHSCLIFTHRQSAIKMCDKVVYL